MYDELSDAALFTHDLYEVHHFWIRVFVINSEPTFDCYWDFDLLAHLCTNLSHKMRFKHKDCTKTTIFGFLRGTSTVDIYFIVSPLLQNFSSLPHFDWVVAT